MTIIPYNNETTGFSLEAFKRSQEEYAERKKVEEERKEKEKIYNKAVAPFESELKKLKASEFKRLKEEDEKFLKRYNKAKKEHRIEDIYLEQVFGGGCGCDYVDLLYKFGSTEYKKRASELEYEISKKEYLLYQ